MIDTIKFKFKVEDKTAYSIRNKSIQLSKYDNLNENEIFSIFTSEIDLPSYNRKVNISINEKNEITLEFSYPKYLYGHNVYLAYNKTLPKVLENIHKIITRKFGKIPNYTQWKVQRLDLCYAWKFKNQQEAEIVLDILFNFKFPRKRKSIYDTSVMYIGSSYSVKFYLKYDEYYKHDFRYLRDHYDVDYAYNILSVSDGVLRFELTLRKKYLDYHFGRDIAIIDVTDLWIETTISELFRKFMKGLNVEYIKEVEVLQRLEALYSNKKAKQLYKFYDFIRGRSDDEIKKFYAQSTLYQYYRELREAEIPMSTEELRGIENFELTIPSDIVVNK